jgi:hypothetical protein
MFRQSSSRAFVRFGYTCLLPIAYPQRILFSLRLCLWKALVRLDPEHLLASSMQSDNTVMRFRRGQWPTTAAAARPGCPAVCPGSPIAFAIAVAIPAPHWHSPAGMGLPLLVAGRNIRRWALFLHR